MKVCIGVSGHSPFDHRVYHKEAVTVAEAGYEVKIIGPWTEALKRRGVEIIPVKPWSSFPGRLRTALAVFGKMLQQRADLYHIHDPEMVPLTWAVKFLTGKPVVVDIHEYYPVVIKARSWLTPGLRRAVSKVIEWVDRVNIRIADAIIVVTPDMEKLFPGAKNCISLINYPRTSFKQNKKEKNENNIKYDLVHCGSLNLSQLSFIIEVAKELIKRDRNYNWLLLGISKSDEDWLKINANQEVRDLFTCIHEIPHEQVHIYLNICKVGIIYRQMAPQYFIALPVKLFEYLYYDLPIVSSPLPLVEHVMQQGDFGRLIKDNTPDSFAQGIISLLENWEEAKEKVKTDFVNISHNYCWEGEAEKLLKIYKSLIKERQS